MVNLKVLLMPVRGPANRGMKRTKKDKLSKLTPVVIICPASKFVYTYPEESLQDDGLSKYGYKSTVFGVIGNYIGIVTRIIMTTRVTELHDPLSKP